MAETKAWDAQNPAGHVQDLSMDAVALANSKLAVLQRPAHITKWSQVEGDRRGAAKAVQYHSVKYNPRKDKWLRCAADDTLQRHVALWEKDQFNAVAEPTLEECGGFPITEEEGAGRKCVVGLSEQRVQELVAHMKPMSSKNKGGWDGKRLPGPGPR
jgi:hypothetical protein